MAKEKRNVGAHSVRPRHVVAVGRAHTVRPYTAENTGRDGLPPPRPGYTYGLQEKMPFSVTR